MLGYEDLVKTLKEVQATGIMDTKTETVCNYQDMIGHSTVGQLRELATGQHKEAFYRVYCQACGVIETLRFYFENSEAITAYREQIADQEAEIESLHGRLDTAEEIRDHFIKEHGNACNGWTQRTAELKDAQDEIKTLKRETIELKARLYDMMTKEA